METEGEKLRVRETPDDSTSDNVIGAVSDGESFEVLSQEDGWIQIKDGYISDQFAQVSYALEEGRKLDEKTKAINQYENLVMSKVNGYLNVRSSPEDKGNANIIGKMTSKAGGEILETLDGWYKVKSGPIVGIFPLIPSTQLRQGGKGYCPSDRIPESGDQYGCVKRPHRTQYGRQDLDPDRKG